MGYKWNKEHPKECVAINRKSRRKTKIEILRHYSPELKCTGINGVCASNCSDIRCLTIDHINGDGAKERKETGMYGWRFYQWLKKNNYPDGYQVLCMNCQFIKRYENHEDGSSSLL